MDRLIVGFHIDEEGDYVAELECGHDQHVRHRPPFIERPWVETEAGRQSMIGKPVECPLCDRLEMPQGMEPYSRTPEFDTQSVPAKLRADHTTKAGIWGKINVLEGTLRYIVAAPVEREFLLDAQNPGVVSPNILHRVEPVDDIRFFVEFYRKSR